MHVHPTHARHILPRMYTARDLVRCTLYVAPQFSSSVVGEKHAQNKPRREKHAQNLQASLSPKPVPPEPGALHPLGTSHRMCLRRR